jgi:hypothetical protein
VDVEGISKLHGEFETLIRHGMAEDEFWKMFIQCSACQRVHLRALFPHLHRCEKRLKYERDVRELRNQHGVRLKRDEEVEGSEDEDTFYVPTDLENDDDRDILDGSGDSDTVTWNDEGTGLSDWYQAQLESPSE